MAEKTCIEICLSGVHSHRSIGIREKLHDPLKGLYNNLKFEFPVADPKLILKVSSEPMEDTIDEDGLAPSRLVLFIVLGLAVISSNCPKQRERVKIIAKAQTEMIALFAKRLVQPAL